MKKSHRIITDGKRFRVQVCGWWKWHTIKMPNGVVPVEKDTLEEITRFVISLELPNDKIGYHHGLSKTKWKTVMIIH